MRNIVKRVSEHLNEWGGQYIATLIISFFIYATGTTKGGDAFFIILLVTFFVITITYNAGHEKAKKTFFKPESTDSEVVSKYGKLIENLTQIAYSPLALPESLLPYSKERIREAIENEMKLCKIIDQVSDDKVKNKKYMDALSSTLGMLDSCFISDEKSVEANLRVKDFLHQRK